MEHYEIKVSVYLKKELTFERVFSLHESLLSEIKVIITSLRLMFADHEIFVTISPDLPF